VEIGFEFEQSSITQAKEATMRFFLPLLARAAQLGSETGKLYRALQWNFIFIIRFAVPSVMLHGDAQAIFHLVPICSIYLLDCCCFVQSLQPSTCLFSINIPRHAVCARWIFNEFD
jgi:hypothetical protein